ncbi:MAG: hypothetical protein J0H88_03350 [Sphingomonadales bacterium]|nr:hypothetical protein [Sphingomonadales bacterium]
MKWKRRQMGFAVSKGSRLLNPEAKSGFDRAFVNLVEAGAGETRDAARRLAAVIAEIGRRARSSQAPSRTRMQIRDEIRTLFERGERLAPESRGAGRQRMQRPTKDTAHFLGRTEQELDLHRRAIDTAEASEIAALRRRQNGLSPAAEARIKNRYAAERAAAERATELSRRLLAHWERRLNPERIDKILAEFVERYGPDRRKLLTLRGEVEKAVERRKTLKGAADIRALDAKIARMRSDAGRLEEAMKDTLRNRFDYNRGEVLKEAFADPGFARDLDSISVILRPRDAGSIEFALEVRTGGPKPSVVFAIPLNVDHGGMDFADAVNHWIESGVTADLKPALAGSNMRMVTEMENSVLLTKLKKDADRWPAGMEAIDPRRAVGVGTVLKATPPQVTRQAVDEIERLLRRRLKPGERDLVDLALSLGE